MDKTPTKTPVKLGSRVFVSPSKVECPCIVCGKVEARTNCRRRLFQVGIKTSSCLELEEALLINVPQGCAYVCVGCLGQLKTAHKKLKNLQGKCEATISQITSKFRQTTTKRMASEYPAEKSRKALFSQERKPLAENAENLDYSNRNTQSVKVCISIITGNMP